VSSYAGRARAYAERVVRLEETAGRLERLACQRFLNDLDRQGTQAFPYLFDEAAGSRACRFIELLPHIKGEWAKPTYSDGKLGYAKIKLEDWQVFLVINLFGWRHMLTQLRRFLRAYLEVARKNAKSTLAAAILLFMTTADGEPGAHTYSAATTGDQAREVFDVARNMALREAEFRLRFGVDVGKHDITIEETASSAKPLNAEGSTLDGLNVHFACVDELHAHKTRAVYDVIDSATGARSQPLILMITTAGSDTSGICYEQRDYTVKVLEGTHADETWFGIVFTIDDEDVWHDPAIWRKANPNLGVSVKTEDLAAAVRKALAMPSALNNVLTKRLNKWVNADTNWMPPDEWKKCGNSKLQLADFAGEKCWIGMDLAEKRDFAALALVFQRGDRFFLFVRLYLNELAVTESGNAHLQGWAHAGYVTVTDGNATDFDVIADDLRNYCQTFDVQEIPFDPALSRYFATKLVAEGLPLVEIRQAPMFFTQPLIQVENLVLERKLEHDDNPVMTWMISNVVVTKSKVTGLKHPTKAREENKIDGPVAGLLALGRALMNGSDAHAQAFLDLNGDEVQTSAEAPV
jgi:phage terminase large subunit-like protein